jgi:hypothetical protein
MGLDFLQQPRLFAGAAQNTERVTAEHRRGRGPGGKSCRVAAFTQRRTFRAGFQIVIIPLVERR